MGLKESLCGLCQSPQNWRGTMDDFLILDLQLVPLQSDPCVYMYEEEGGIRHPVFGRGRYPRTS